MTINSESLAALALLEGQLATPPRISVVFAEFKTFLGERDPTRALLKEFVRDTVHALLEAINLPLMRELATSTIDLIRQDTGIDYGTIAFKGTATGEVDIPEVQRTLGIIFTHLGTCQRQREQATHYTGVLKHAENHLKAFRSALNEFVCDEDNVEGAWRHLSERQRAADALLVDIDAYMGTLGSIRTELTSTVESVLGQRAQLLLRAESGLRLLAKFNEQDSMANRGQSRNNTTSSGDLPPGSEPDTSGFAIER